jgi:hypothetical protein
MAIATNKIQIPCMHTRRVPWSPSRFILLFYSQIQLRVSWRLLESLFPSVHRHHPWQST